MGNGARLSLRDILVIHDEEDEWVGRVARQLATQDVTTRRAGSLEAVDAELDRSSFDAAFFDVRALPPPDWYHALERLTSSSPAPLVVAWGGELTAFEGFHLGRLGVRQLLPRRPPAEKTWTVLDEALHARPAFDPHIRATVGHATLGETVERVRRLFLDQGLGLRREDRSKTARLIGVTRQAVQQMIRRYAGDEPEWPRESWTSNTEQIS